MKPARPPPPLEESPTQRVLRLCLYGASKVNRIVILLTQAMQVLVVPQISGYQWRVYMLFAARLFCSDLVMVCAAKILQVYYGMENFLLLLSLGSLLPFLWATYNLWRFIPCPPMASVVSNASLVFAMLLLVMLGYETYQQDVWKVYTYVMAVWPWLVVASAVARLYVERNTQKNPFSPVREVPIIGILSAFIYVFILMPAKDISLTECIVMCVADPILAAVFASLLLGSHRRQLHSGYIKVYAVLLVLIVLYVRAGDIEVSSNHLQFIGARILLVVRSVWVKWLYGNFHHSEVPYGPPEDRGLFSDKQEKPVKNRFRKFPGPLLFTLDVVFDSGLRDSDFHGMGKLGTQDMYLLTECTYLLPVASIMCWLREWATVSQGVLPYTWHHDTPTALEVVTAGDAGVVQIIREALSTSDVILYSSCVGIFIFARLMNPWVVSHTLFDPGSSPHSWQYDPILLAAPVFAVDILSLNGELTKTQIFTVLGLYAVFGHYRSYLWNRFKRKYLLLMTQEFHYLRPAALRQLHKRTLLEFLEKTSTDDFYVMLLETAVQHGSNIRELARDTTAMVWDPAPTATAAWKMAFSLVTKVIRKKKLQFKKKKKDKAAFQSYVEKMLLELVDKAVEQSAGAGTRLELAGSMSSVMGKRRAIRRLQEYAEQMKERRRLRRAGKLADAPGPLLRSKPQDMRVSRSREVVALPAPPTSTVPVGAITGGEAGLHMSLTASFCLSPCQGESSPLLSMPGEMPDFLTDASPRRNVQKEDTRPRGVWDLADDVNSLPGSIVVAFGDGSNGQTGLQPGFATQHTRKSLVVPLEELRGYDPVQVVAAGVATFVVGKQGRVWVCGSNRCTELGLRKEVTQVNAPQKVKSLADYLIVQVASSCAVSGQVHTLALTSSGEVYTFGASSAGALGQGPDVRQTPPLKLRMTLDVRVKQIAAGANHSIFITDDGKLYTVGNNNRGQLGLGRKENRHTDEPELIEKSDMAWKAVRFVAAGDNHNIACTTDGQVFGWGANADGQLGLGRHDDQALPQLITALAGLGITSLACGSRHSVAVSPGRKHVWVFGSNVRGQLGLGQNSTQQSKPMLCPTLSNKVELEVEKCTAACNHTLVLTRAGEVYSFGDNTYGQLGFAREEAHRPGDTAAVSGGSNTLAKNRLRVEIDAPRSKSDGVSRIWVPSRILSLGNYSVKAIATADRHSLALCA